MNLLHPIIRMSLAIASLPLIVFTLVNRPTVSAADDMETIRARILAPLLAAPDIRSVESLLKSMGPGATWNDIDYTNQSPSAWPVPIHLYRTGVLARAYCAPDSARCGDQEVLAAAGRALDGWLRLDPQNPNWWWNQIGVPKALLPVLLLLDDDLSDAQRSDGLKILRRATIGMTGQNLVWVTEITAGRGLLEHDAELVARAYRRIADEIRIDLGEGIQPDGFYAGSSVTKSILIE